MCNWCKTKPQKIWIIYFLTSYPFQSTGVQFLSHKVWLLVYVPRRPCHQWCEVCQVCQVESLTEWILSLFVEGHPMLHEWLSRFLVIGPSWIVTLSVIDRKKYFLERWTESTKKIPKYRTLILIHFSKLTKFYWKTDDLKYLLFQDSCKVFEIYSKRIPS